MTKEIEQKKLKITSNASIELFLSLLGDEINKWKAPFLPKESFYLDWKNDNASLWKMSLNILSWLKITPKEDLVVSFYEKIDSPGLFAVINGKETILINVKYLNDPLSVGAILSHELMHWYLKSKNIHLEDTEENELLTDLATIYTGLGILVINGMEYESSWHLTLLLMLFGFFYFKKKEKAFGYFTPAEYIYNFKRYLDGNRVPLMAVLGYVVPPARHYIPGAPFFYKIKPQLMIVKYLEEKTKKEMLEKAFVCGFIFLIIIFLLLSNYFPK